MLFCRQYSWRAAALRRKSSKYTGLAFDQIPFGERKSGIPLSVLIPAPVKATTERADFIQSATSSAFCMWFSIAAG